MKLSDEQIQELLRVGNPSAEECRLIRMGWDAAMRTQGIPDGYKLMPVEPTKEKICALPGAQAQPAPSVPEVTDAMIEAIESRAEQSYRRHHGGARGQQIVPADALSWHIIHATRKVLSEAPEAKP